MQRIKLFEDFTNENDSLTTRIEHLEDLVDKAAEAFDKQWFSVEHLKSMDKLPADVAYERYATGRRKAIGQNGIELSKLKTQERMERKPTFTAIPDYGDVMTLKDFIDNVKSGGFIDYDGSGNYVKDDKMSDIQIFPSDVKKGNIRKDFDKIVWFNR